MSDLRVSVDLDLGDVPDDALRFAQAIANGCRNQSRHLFGALSYTLAQERSQRDDGLAAPVLFSMPYETIVDAYEAARVALGHSVLCNGYGDRAAENEPEHEPGWRSLAGAFLKIHFEILRGAGPDDLLAFHAAFTSSPTNAA